MGFFVNHFFHLFLVASSLCWILGIMFSQLKCYQSRRLASHSSSRQYRRLKALPLLFKKSILTKPMSLWFKLVILILYSKEWEFLEVTQVSWRARWEQESIVDAVLYCSAPLLRAKGFTLLTAGSAARWQAPAVSSLWELLLAEELPCPNTGQCLRAVSVWGHPKESLRPCCDCIACLPLSNPVSFTSFTVADPRALPNKLPAC